MKTVDLEIVSCFGSPCSTIAYDITEFPWIFVYFDTNWNLVMGVILLVLSFYMRKKLKR